MDQKLTKGNIENRLKTRTKRKFLKIRLEDLQQYFDYHLFYIEDCGSDDGYEEELYRQYREQAIEFLYSIGAMLNVEKFLDVEGHGVVYVRQLPPGVTPLHNP